MLINDDQNQEIFIFGAGGHSKVVSDCIKANLPDCRQPDLVFVDIEDRGDISGHSVISESEFFSFGGGKRLDVVIAIGDNAMRSSVRDRLLDKGDYSFPVVIHPRAMVAPNAVIRNGALICAGAIVGPDAVIGSFTILNHACIVDHDCSVSDFASLGPNATLSGGVVVGEYAMLGASSNVLPSIYIGARSVVGAGSVVVSDVPEGQTVRGVPAKAAPCSNQQIC